MPSPRLTYLCFAAAVVSTVIVIAVEIKNPKRDGAKLYLLGRVGEGSNLRHLAPGTAAAGD